VSLDKHISTICIFLAVLVGMLTSNLEMFNLHMHMVILAFTFNSFHEAGHAIVWQIFTHNEVLKVDVYHFSASRHYD
jgi:hypothetical protein